MQAGIDRAFAVTTSSVTDFDPVPRLALELSLPASAVGAVTRLLAEGATVPFIARYRKEATGGLDEVQIRAIEERRAYVLELEQRRASILKEIGDQGKLTPELEKRLRGVETKAELEDLYLPFKPKRRTRATIAKERGLEPLADRMWTQAGDESPDAEAASFVDAAKEVPDVAAALAGARDICAERVAENAEVRKLVRELTASEGVLEVKKTKDHEDKPTKFDTYAAYAEPVAKIPSHRFLAIRRGENEGVLRAGIAVDADKACAGMARVVGVRPTSPWAKELGAAVNDAYKRLLAVSVEMDVRVEMKLAADKAAVGVFAQNLRELLLAAPFGQKTVLGIDPGQRTGCKCAVVDETGKLLAHETIYLVQGDGALERSKQTLRALVEKYSPRAVAVGNGTHGRETEAFVREVLSAMAKSDVPCVPVSESGASVYSASDIAREEFPDLDLTIRGAVSIARRLQDPLAELVKVDPKSIGVGQYQHDVNAGLLARKLDDVVETCVNLVGVELNTASAPLLARVAGIGPSLAKKIVSHRDASGAFTSRKALLSVPGLGPRAFEQCAGFLRVHGDQAHPLDGSAVHPERYPLVERMAKDLGVEVSALVGHKDDVARLDKKAYVEGDVGTFTIDDILAELSKPGRDPRASFAPPKFRDDVRTMQDLKQGMELEGVVTNVTAFGAFVDVGVHQDGLVHVSQLADRFVKDPSEVVKAGDRITVRVLEIDLVRNRIALTARKGGERRPEEKRTNAPGPRPDGRREPARHDQAKARPAAEPFRNNPFERLLRK